MSMVVAEGEEEEDAAEVEAEEDMAIVMIIVEGVVAVAVVEVTCVILVDTIPGAHPGIHVVAAVVVVMDTLLEEVEDHPSRRLLLLLPKFCLLLQAVLEARGKCLLKKNSKLGLTPCVKSLWNFITRKNCFFLWMKFLVRPMLSKSSFELM